MDLAFHSLVFFMTPLPCVFNHSPKRAFCAFIEACKTRQGLAMKEL
jgi:hypothetical protein